MGEFIKWLTVYVSVLALSALNTYFYCKVVDIPFNHNIMWFGVMIIFSLKFIVEIAIINNKTDDK